MSIYSGFARAYDFLMKDVDYDKWVQIIETYFKKYNYNGKVIFELACGTGNITERLFKKGYNIIGTDISEEMLMIAQEKSYENHHMINFINQDMRDINYRKKVDAILSICDGINYITSSDDLKSVINGAHRILNENGLFIFDISSEFKLKNILSNNTFAEVFDDASYIWENFFDEETNILEFDLTIFLKSDDKINDEDFLYEKYTENHIQKAHSIKEIKTVLNDKFEILDIVDGDTGYKLMNDSQRILFVCKKI
ncbi:class I SAM-dependent methyltransferase [Helicovermis profundi]|uniref:Class I SAM-dependent methyltransferase n=2 Tax=Helicovermis profundi TaxID=3065157 RepID=A0AAU9EX12_9FIRM|nr:class I SAM-dependent methyltransferase [Clostridia bacterium S502]